MRPTRAEIHIDHFLHNLRYIRERVGDATKIMAIVKANAYGHGLDIIARAALESGYVHSFGVATEEEGIRLRKLTSRPILVLTSALAEEIDIFLSNDLEFTLAEHTLLERIADRARALGTKARVHVKIDTGMRRIGIAPQDSVEFLRCVLEQIDVVELAGISTHFATSDELDLGFFDHQLSTFRSVLTAVQDAGIPLPEIHAANSGAILQRPKDAAFDIVRPGIMLYGYTPSLELNERYGEDLRPVLELSSCVVFKKTVNKGEGVSYNLRWRAARDTNIVTVPLGYGDGYPRTLTNKAQVIVRGKVRPVVGTICMDQVMVDVGEEDVSIGEKVTFISTDPDSITAWTLAQTIGTIPYEILTNIAARVPRVVKDEVLSE